MGVNVSASSVPTAHGAPGVPPSAELTPDVPPDRMGASGAPEAPSAQNGRVAGNAAIYLAGQTLSWAATLVTMTLIPRQLGESAMGEYAVVGATISTASALLSCGIEQYLITEIGRSRHRTEALLRATFGLRLVMLPSLFALTAIMLWVSKASPSIWLLTAPMLIHMGFLFVSGPLRHVVMAWEDAKRVSLYDISTSAAPLLSLPFLRFGILVVPITNLICFLPLQTALLLWMRRRLHVTPQFDRVLWRELIRGGLPLVTNDLILQLYGYGSVFLLRRYAGDAALGVLSQALKLQGACLFLPSAVSAALLPVLARLAEQDKAQFRSVQRRIFGVMTSMALPVAALLFLLATPLCHLVYGTEQFQDLPLVLQASAFNILPIYIASVIYRFLVAERKSASWSVFLLGTALLNVALCAVFIPWSQRVWGNAAVGAAAASVVAECATVVAAFVLLKNNPFDKRSVAQIGKAALATAGLCGVVYLTRSYFIVVPAALGTATFLILAWFLGVLEPEERDKLTGAVRRKLRRS